MKEIRALIDQGVSVQIRAKENDLREKQMEDDHIKERIIEEEIITYNQKVNYYWNEDESILNCA